MKAVYATSLMALAVALSQPAAAQTAGTATAPAGDPVEAAQTATTAPAPVAEEATGPQVNDIIVTAQRRSTRLQDTSAAISAFGGASLEEDRVLRFEDLAGQATSLSFTALSPLDQEFNVRGITNTRLDSPTADRSVSSSTTSMSVAQGCSTSTFMTSTGSK